MKSDTKIKIKIRMRIENRGEIGRRRGKKKVKYVTRLGSVGDGTLFWRRMQKMQKMHQPAQSPRIRIYIAPMATSYLSVCGVT